MPNAMGTHIAVLAWAPPKQQNLSFDADMNVHLPSKTTNCATKTTS